ncbi:unnamed protein product [Brassica rapa subsp. narinosa]
MAKVKKKKKQSLPFGKASSRLLSLISGGFFRKSAPPSSGSSASVKAPVTVSPPVTVTPPVTVAPPVTVTPPSPTSKSELVSSKPDFSKTKVLATAQDFCVVEGSSSDTASPEESNLLNWRNLALLLPMFQGLLLSSYRMTILKRLKKSLKNSSSLGSGGISLLKGVLLEW